MIPKIIHYCWFGRGEKPELAKKCIESWKKYLPDYEIKEWNEDNFDININDYCKEAYEAKKYAFVSDVARLAIVYRYGGIYFDVDVEIIKPFETLLKNQAFFGFEDGKHVNTGLGFGAQKGNKVIKKMLDDYNQIKFKNDDKYDLTPCPIRNTKILIELGLNQNNQFQKFEDCTIYPSDYFCPKDLNTFEVNITKNSYSIHHFDGSWFSPEERKLVTKRKRLVEKYGEKKGLKIYKTYMLFRQFKYKVKKVILCPKLIIQKILQKNK